MRSVLLLLAFVLPLAGFAEPAAPAEKEWVYFGTYTGRGSEGIYVAEFGPATGALGEPKLAVKAVNPSFLAIHPNRRFLYAVNEVSTVDGKKGGGVTGFTINSQTGMLTAINSQSSGGAGPCHLSLDHEGKGLYVANYGGGSVASMLVREDGSLGDVMVVVHTGSGPNKARQEKAHAHSINVSPDNTYAVAADLGTDIVMVYGLNEERRLIVRAPARTPAGGGPRHFAFHPSGRFGYANNELASTVTTFVCDAQSTLTALETISSIPSDYRGGGGSAEIQVHPNGKFLYVSNRGHDSLAVFRIEEEGRKLVPTGHVPTGGKTPRNFCVHPAGQFLLAANQDSDNVVVFRIDPATGMPQPTGKSIQLKTPVCVRFLKPI